MVLESTKQGSEWLIGTKAAVTEAAWVYAKPSACMVWLLAWCFVGILTVDLRMSLSFFVLSWDPFSFTRSPHPPLICGLLLVLLLPGYAMFDEYPWAVNSFLTGSGGKVDPEERETREGSRRK